MLISNSKNFIFYHVYKVAGTSIRNELLPYTRRSQVAMQALTYGLGTLGVKTALPPIYYYHPSLSDVKSYLGPRFYEYYRFCFVRDPFDWQKSLYFFAKKNKRHHQHGLINEMSFDEYIDWRVSKDLKLQSDLIFDHDECLVDVIGRFESIQTDFADICKKIDIPYNLRHLNQAGLGQKVSITKRSLDTFKDAFRLDYDRLGYDIDRVNVS